MNRATHRTTTSRRAFLGTSVAAGALASPMARPAVVSGAPHTQTLRLGLVGCGGRGSGAAVNALKADGNVELTAMGDLFEDQIQSSLAALGKELPGKVKVPPNRRFVGFEAYRRVIEHCDVVLLTTPPGFRPQHLEAAVEAGRHSFAEITAAIDAPGVRSVLRSSERAKKKGLAIVSGFCWRYDAALRAAVDQIRAGAIGQVRAVYATYYRGDLGHKLHGPRPAGLTDLVWQLRDWYGHLWLSGDVTILLSGGHSVDKMTWFLDEIMPAKAVAVGSRVFPTDGNTFDNCFVAYEYPGGIRGFLGCRSQSGCHAENADYVVGAKGVCTIGRGPAPSIQGENAWRYTGPKGDMYQTEHDELFASIRSGKPINDGPRMARTTLMAVMGRMAAYTGREVSWEEALNSQDRLVPERLDWNTPVAPRPLAVPGITKLT